MTFKIEWSDKPFPAPNVKMLGLVGKRVRFEVGWAKVLEEYEYDVRVKYEEDNRVRQVRKGAILETA